MMRRVESFAKQARSHARTMVRVIIEEPLNKGSRILVTPIEYNKGDAA